MHDCSSPSRCSSCWAILKTIVLKMSHITLTAITARTFLIIVCVIIPYFDLTCTLRKSPRSNESAKAVTISLTRDTAPSHAKDSPWFTHECLDPRSSHYISCLMVHSCLPSPGLFPDAFIRSHMGIWKSTSVPSQFTQISYRKFSWSIFYESRTSELLCKWMASRK